LNLGVNCVLGFIPPFVLKVVEWDLRVVSEVLLVEWICFVVFLLNGVFSAVFLRLAICEGDWSIG